MSPAFEAVAARTRQEIEDENSPDYYDELDEKFLQNPETLRAHADSLEGVNLIEFDSFEAWKKNLLAEG